MKRLLNILLPLATIAVLAVPSLHADPIALNDSELSTIAAGARGTAGDNNNNLATPADTIHPNIHQNNSPGSAACPGQKAHCNNMHGIANVPGQSGANPADNGPGFADQLQTVHGGIALKNKNTGG